MIELRNVYKKFAGQDEFLFQGANLKVAAGELVVVTGPAGSGKSTLQRMLAAREAPDKGSIYIRSQDCFSLRAHEMAAFRRSIGESSHDIELIAKATVFDNLTLPLVIKGMNNKANQANANALLQSLGLGLKAQLWCTELSRIEQHLLRIARAIVSQPAVILCDDPFEGCDESLSRQIVDLLWNARSNGSTIMITTNQANYFSKKPRRQYLISDKRLHENHITQFPSPN